MGGVDLAALLPAVLLAALDGLAKVLPLSAGAHFAALELLLGWSEPGPAIAFWTGTGSLLAILGYCWRDVLAMGSGLLRRFRRKRNPGASLLLLLIVASLPLGAAGLAWTMGGFSTQWAEPSINFLGLTTIAGAILLLLGDRYGMTIRRLDHLGPGGALFIGVIQALSLLPGMGRACMAIAAARAMDFERPEAVRISALLAIPALIATLVLNGRVLLHGGGLTPDPAAVGLAVIALLATLLGLALLMRWLRRHGFLPLVLYRLALGALLLAQGQGLIG